MTLYHWKNRFVSERLHYKNRLVTVFVQKEKVSTDCIDVCLDNPEICNRLLMADHCNDLPKWKSAYVCWMKTSSVKLCTMTSSFITTFMYSGLNSCFALSDQWRDIYNSVYANFIRAIDWSQRRWVFVVGAASQSKVCQNFSKSLEAFGR